MIRCVTFGLLSLLVLLGSFQIGLFSGDQPYGISAALILVAMLAIIHLCDQSEFSDHLTAVDQETSQITWPNRIQLVHAVKVGVSFLAILAIGLSCLDSLVSFCLELLA